MAQNVGTNSIKTLYELRLVISQLTSEANPRTCLAQNPRALLPIKTRDENIEAPKHLKLAIGHWPLAERAVQAHLTLR